MPGTERRFVPPHCPRSHCRFHRCAVGWRWVRYGFYSRQCPPRTIARFRCRHCRATFSTQSFSSSYYLKRPELLEPLGFRLLAGSGYRQIAREARCAHSTVMGQAARLGRHALLFLHAQRPRGALLEPLVIDGFESFAYSQYHPLHLNLAVGSQSHYLYAFTHAELRRKGRMTAAQKRRRVWLERSFGRPDPRALETSIVTLLELAAPTPQPLTVRSDEHPAYPRALRRLAAWELRHECTPSVQARTTRNPLFPVNRLDLLLRHNCACHKRETIAFAKRHQAVVERAALLAVWLNFVKPFSENHGGGTPAMRLGQRSSPLTLQQVLSARLFPGHVPLPPEWERYYRRLVPTARLPRARSHRLTLAF
jgi:transposase-like protein